MNRKALRVVADFLADKVASAPIDQQITLYQALAQIMPTDRERRAARAIATALSKAAAMQTDFNAQLFQELQWPGHRHDGEGDGKGKS